MSGNNLACRIYHAGVAASDPALHCKHAGPGGDATCGTNCEGFCTLAMGACAGQATPPYASMGACMTSCAAFNIAPPDEASQTGGDTFACHLDHARRSLPPRHARHPRRPALPLSARAAIAHSYAAKVNVIWRSASAPLVMKSTAAGPRITTLNEPAISLS